MRKCLIFDHRSFRFMGRIAGFLPITLDYSPSLRQILAANGLLPYDFVPNITLGQRARRLLMKLKRFQAKKGLWVSVSVLVFLLSWLCPMYLPKEGYIPMGSLWVDLVGGAYGAGQALAILSGVFAAFAGLVGFAVQALVVVWQNRGAQQSAFRESRDDLAVSGRTPVARGR